MFDIPNKYVVLPQSTWSSQNVGQVLPDLVHCNIDMENHELVHRQPVKLVEHVGPVVPGWET